MTCECEQTYPHKCPAKRGHLKRNADPIESICDAIEEISGWDTVEKHADKIEAMYAEETKNLEIRSEIDPRAIFCMILESHEEIMKNGTRIGWHLTVADGIAFWNIFCSRGRFETETWMASSDTDRDRLMSMLRMVGG